MEILQDSQNKHSIHKLLTKAFVVYDEVCRARSQWVVQSSRAIGKMMHWNNPETGNDSERISYELNWRYSKAWHSDGDALIVEALRAYEIKLGVVS